MKNASGIARPSSTNPERDALKTALPPAPDVAALIGPRKAGVRYDNINGTFEVQAVHYGHEARIRVGRAVAPFAVTIRNTVTNEVSHTCAAWIDGSDRLITKAAV